MMIRRGAWQCALFPEEYILMKKNDRLYGGTLPCARTEGKKWVHYLMMIRRGAWQCALFPEEYILMEKRIDYMGAHCHVPVRKEKKGALFDDDP